MIPEAAPHFLWTFVLRYIAHQLNLWPLVSQPEVSSTLLWTGQVGDVSVFRVWGSTALVRDPTADKLSPLTVRCVFLGFPTDAPDWPFYHPATRRILFSRDVTFDESVCYYRLYPHRCSPVPFPPLFLVPSPPQVDPLHPPGPAPSGVSHITPLPSVVPLELSSDSSGPEGGDPAADDTLASRRSPCLETPPGFPPRLSSPPLQPGVVDSGGPGAVGGGDARGTVFGGADSRGAGFGGADSRGVGGPLVGGVEGTAARGSWGSGGAEGPLVGGVEGLTTGGSGAALKPLPQRPLFWEQHPSLLPLPGVAAVGSEGAVSGGSTAGGTGAGAGGAGARAGGAGARAGGAGAGGAGAGGDGAGARGAGAGGTGAKAGGAVSAGAGPPGAGGAPGTGSPVVRAGGAGSGANCHGYYSSSTVSADSLHPSPLVLTTAMALPIDGVAANDEPVDIEVEIACTSLDLLLCLLSKASNPQHSNNLTDTTPTAIPTITSAPPDSIEAPVIDTRTPRTHLTETVPMTVHFSPSTPAEASPPSPIIPPPFQPPDPADASPASRPNPAASQPCAPVVASPASHLDPPATHPTVNGSCCWHRPRLGGADLGVGYEECSRPATVGELVDGPGRPAQGPLQGRQLWEGNK
ncbi:unnamed protein product [Closterium sp. NIES-53]